MRPGLHPAVAVIGLALGLSGCAEDWLGHPGQPDQTPASTAWLWSTATQTLVDDTLAGLPPTVVDHAAYVRTPAPASGLLAGLRMRAWADAVAVRPGHEDWRAPYVTRLKEQLEQVAHPVQPVVLTHAVTTPDDRTDRTDGPLTEGTDDWPDDWRVVTSAAEQADRWVHGLMLLGSGQPAGTIWLDLTAIEDFTPALSLATSLASAGRTVLLLGCMRGSEDRLTACIRALRSTPNEARLFLLIDGLGNPLTAPGLLNIALQQIDLFDRMRYASAYPYPAINTNVSLDRLVMAGLLADDDVAPLRAIYAHNPWLFDLVLKRRLKLPGTSLGFSPDVFGPLPTTDEAPA